MSFAAYFTRKGAWRSCEVQELGRYRTEGGAMGAGEHHAAEAGVPVIASGSGAPRHLAWARNPDGLVAKTALGRYDIRTVRSPS